MLIEATPDTGAITAEQAMGLLGKSRESQTDAPVEAAPEPALEVVEQPQSEGVTEPEDGVEPEEVTTPEAEEEPEAEEPPIQPPQSWSAADKAHFESLPRDVQEVIARRESDRDKAVQRSIQEAADARKEAATAKTEAQAVTQIKAVLDQIVPLATQAFNSEWSDWTPAAQAELAQKNPAEYVAKKAWFEAQAAEVKRLNDVNAQVQQAAYQQFVEAELAKLPEKAPDLADPKEGPARRVALSAFLVENGVPADQIPLLDANTIGLAYDAMRWRQAQAKAALAVRPRTPAAAPATPSLRPAAAQAAPSRQRSRDTAMERLSATGTIDDAVRALKAQRG